MAYTFLAAKGIHIGQVRVPYAQDSAGMLLFQWPRSSTQGCPGCLLPSYLSKCPLLVSNLPDADSMFV